MKRAFFLILSGIAGSMGLGAGTVLILYLTLFENIPQTKAQGINLLFSLPVAALSIFIYKKKGLIVPDGLPWLILCGIVGAVVGYFVLDRITPALLSKIFGAILVVLAVYQLFSRKKRRGKAGR